MTVPEWVHDLPPGKQRAVRRALRRGWTVRGNALHYVVGDGDARAEVAIGEEVAEDVIDLEARIRQAERSARAHTQATNVNVPALPWWEVNGPEISAFARVAIARGWIANAAGLWYRADTSSPSRAISAVRGGLIDFWIGLESAERDRELLRVERWARRKATLT